MRAYKRIPLLIMVLGMLLACLGAPVQAKGEPICEVCEKKIRADDLIVFDGKNYHKNHRPRCNKCNKALETTAFSRGELRYCSKDCMRLGAPRCKNCGKSINDDNFKQVRRGIFICDDCWENKLSKCAVCGVPVAIGGASRADGAKLCGVHALPSNPRVLDPNKGAEALNIVLPSGSDSDPIVRDEQLVPYFQLAQAYIIRYVSPRLDISANPPALRVEDDTGGHVGGSTWGLATYQYMKYSGGAAYKYNFVIYILKGLYPQDAMSTLCHEMAHIWHYRNANTDGFSKRKMEGFAEWVCYKVNKGLGRDWQMAGLIRKNSEDYRGGLQDYLKIESESGVEGVLRYAVSRE